MNMSASSRADFTARLDAVAAEIDALLDELLSERREAGELARPARLLEAMRYAVLSGGKRLRPFLIVETAALFGVARDRARLRFSASANAYRSARSSFENWVATRTATW